MMSRGDVTAVGSIVPGITQDIMVSLEPNSSAMGARETARIVTGKDVANIPARAEKSTQFR